MKKLSFMSAILAVLLSSCGGRTDDPQAIIDKYCALSSKVYNAPAGAAKEAAAAEKRAYEKQVDEKYSKDTKTYQRILEGMKKCDEMQASTPVLDSSIDEEDLLAMLPLAGGDAATVAKAYCNLAEKSMAVAKNGTDADLKKVMAAKMMFEHNMEESYKNNEARRDSIFKLIMPCIEKEAAFRRNNR